MAHSDCDETDVKREPITAQQGGLASPQLSRSQVHHIIPGTSILDQTNVIFGVPNAAVCAQLLDTVPP